MNFIDHPVLYTDDFTDNKWLMLVERANGQGGFWRKYARRKMRRVVKELLNNVRPRIETWSFI